MENENDQNTLPQSEVKAGTSNVFAISTKKPITVESDIDPEGIINGPISKFKSRIFQIIKDHIIDEDPYVLPQNNSKKP